jgi:peptidoglycan hydrolase-like protein with peptidoglycan-binding domain
MRNIEYPCLRLGDQGDDVVWLQTLVNQRLASLGAQFAQLKVDGLLGPITLKLIHYLQSLACLPIEDTVNLITWDFLEHGTESLPELSLGATGSMVWAIQQTLTSDGFNLTIDGQFGSQTADTIKTFQKHHQLMPTGIVGPLTWRQLIHLRLGNPDCYRWWQS